MKLFTLINYETMKGKVFSLFYKSSWIITPPSPLKGKLFYALLSDGKHFEKCVLRWFCHVNIVECTYTDLDATQPATNLRYTV